MATRDSLGSDEVGSSNPSVVLRFRQPERALHWALAVPFIACLVTAAVLVLDYNPAPTRPYRDTLSWIHRVAGVCLIVFPTLALARNRGDYRLHLQNIKQAWVWTAADLKWLALAVTPLVIGHTYMALTNPGTRDALPGMVTGYVDRDWAKHHYRQWYRDYFEEGQGDAELPNQDSARNAQPAADSVEILCPTCRERYSTPAESLAESLLQASVIECPACGSELKEFSAITHAGGLRTILDYMDRAQLSDPVAASRASYALADPQPESGLHRSSSSS